MKHAREDYARIQDPENKIGEDEPVMLFRAQDKFFIDVLYFYRALLERDNPKSELIPLVTDHIKRVYAWQQDNADKVKFPDYKPG